MNRDQKARKQTLFPKNLHRPTPHNPQAFILQKHRFKIRPASLLVGLTATVGITSIAFAATQQGVHVKSSQINKAQASTSAPLNNKSSTDVTIDSSSAATGEQQNDTMAQGQTQTNNSNAQITINNESIPVNNGTVQRTFTDSNGSTYSVTVNIDANSTSHTFSHSSTDININTSGSSSSDNTARGSPRR